MIKVTCQCGAILNVKDEYAGKRGKCPKCDQVILIPELEIVEVQMAEEAPIGSPYPAYAAPANPFEPAPAAPNPFAPANPFATQEFNPYQAPQAPLLPSAVSSSSTGQELMVRDGLIYGKSPIVLPQYCVECGEPVEIQNYKTKTLSHASPWLALLILAPAGLLLLLILYFIMRKKCQISYGYCNVHRQKRRRWIIGCVLTTIGSFFAMPMTIAFFQGSRKYETISGLLAFGFMLLFIGSLIAIPFVSAGLYIKSHKDGIFAIKHCKPAFLKWIQ